MLFVRPVMPRAVLVVELTLAFAQRARQVAVRESCERGRHGRVATPRRLITALEDPAIARATTIIPSSEKRRMTSFCSTTERRTGRQESSSVGQIAALVT